MRKYVVKIFEMALADRDEYVISTDYRFYNEMGHLNIECEEDACKNITTHPSLLRNAIFLAFPEQVISPYCADEIYKTTWQSVILWSFYTNAQYPGNVKVVLDDTALKKIKKWYSLLAANASNTNRLKTFWNFSLEECLSTYGINSIEQNYLALSIALEGLFVNSNYKVEAQLENNIPEFLCQSIADKERMKDFLHQMHRIRCNVAHGNLKALIKKLKNEKVFEDFLTYRKIVVEALLKSYGMDKQTIKKNSEANKQTVV